MPKLRSSFFVYLIIVSLALFFVACRKESSTPSPSSSGGPIIIISIDTLRADHLPVYGATGVETPVIDELASDSIVFENAYSQVPLTLPSHVSMLTGTLPATNGVRNNLGYQFDASVPTIPGRLKERGYVTGAAVSSYVLRGAVGLGQVFDDYDDSFDSKDGSLGEIQRPGPETVARAIEWIDEQDDESFFYFLHLFEPHTPYSPPEPFLTKYEGSPYKGEIAAADAAIGPLIEKLKASGLYEKSTIVFMSDHGEGLGDHGELEHGIFLYREAIHVPLIVKLPDNELAGTRVDDAVGLIDLFPTIVGPGDGPGVSLVSIARGEGSDRTIFSETMYPRIHLGWSDLASLSDETWQYIEAPKPELYDVVKDPGEKDNVLADNRRVYAAMRKAMETYDRSLEAPAEISEEDAAKLSALGYLGGTSGQTEGDLPDPKDRIDDMNAFLEAGNLLQLGKPGEAIDALKGVLERNPSFADAWTVLGKAYQDTNQLEKSLDAYKHTIELAPRLAPGSALSMSEVYLRLGQFDECIAHAELAREIHPGAVALVVARANLARGDLAAAEREAMNLQTDPSRIDDGTIIVAQARIKQKRYEEALELLNGVAERVSGRKKPPANLWFARGDLMARVGNVPEAVTAFGEETKLYPGNRESYVRLAVLQTLSGSEAEAMATFRRMVEANPGESSYRLAANAFRQIGRPDLAARWSEGGARPMRLATLLAGASFVFAMLGGCSGGEKPVSAAPDRAPVILISIDTLRADRLPAYGYAEVSTPAMDRLAAESVVFENAYSHVPLTLPSHVSILTGLLPPDHGVRNNIGYSWDTDTYPSVTQRFSEAGYRTGAAISAYVLRGSTGIVGAFDFYDDSIANRQGAATGQLQRSGEETTEIARQWIAEQGGEPFFFMLHLFEPHSPYDPPQPFRDRYADRYDGEIAASDAVLESFFDFLRESGVYDRATIVLLSDHGEGLNDHGEEEHGVFLYREAIHVPLMIKLPGGDRAGTRIATPVELIDVAPTLVQIAGLSGENTYPGVSLIDGPLPDDRRIYSETLYPRLHLGWSDLRSLIDVRHHYIEAPSPELYDHIEDPGERNNVLADNRRVYASMRDELDGYEKNIEGPSNIDPEAAAKLAALGYIGTVQNPEGELPDPKNEIDDFEKMKRAGRLAAGGRQSDAVEIVRGIVAENPRFADAWSLLAVALEQMGRDDEAIEAYKGGLRNSSVLKDEMALSLAGLLLKTERYDEAWEHAELALDGQPAGAHQMMARIAIAREDFVEAENQARMAMSDPTMSPRSAVILAQAKAKQGKTEEALGILRDTRVAANAKGMSVEYLDYAIGDILAAQQKWQEAEAAFLSEIESFPDHLQAYTSLTVVYVLSGQFDKVDATLNRMVEANPSRRACLTAAETLEALGDSRTAAQWRREADKFN